ncbi:MAG: hypothetical protein AAF568_10875, partial [Pseudomonadota bacterium]
GLSEYIRVRDYRVQQLQKMPNVEIYLESELTAEDVLELAPDHVAIATGAAWRRDRHDGEVFQPFAGGGSVTTPDDIMAGRMPAGPVALFEQGGYYMGAVLAERLRAEGLAVTYVTEDASAAPWTDNTGEGGRTRRRLVSLGVEIVTHRTVSRYDGAVAELSCVYGGPTRQVPASGLVAVTARAPRDNLYHALRAKGDLPFTLTRIGDCEAPGIIAQAVHAGHLYARELELPTDRDQPLRHERVALTERDPGQRYRDTLTLYYEEEVMGEAYFDAIADRMTGEAKVKMRLLADVERQAQKYVEPLLARHGLTPRARADLLRLGRAEAEAETGDFPALIAAMRESFPGYVDDFLKLEAMAPMADRDALACLTEHETAAIEFLEREDAGRPDADAPLRRYIGTPP